MIDEPFSEGSTLLHRSDARVKILAALVLILVLALTQSLLTATCGIGLGTILVLTARLNGRLVLRRLLAVNAFTLFLWLTLPFSYHSRDLIPTTLQYSQEGLHLAALITLKSNGIVLCLLALLATSTIARLGRGLEGLGAPRRLTFLFLASYRHIFLIHQEFKRLLRAARLRGFVPGNNLHTYRTMAHLQAMTLIKAWNRGQRVHQAMLLRGFNGHIHTLDQPQLTSIDLAFLTSLTLAAIGLSSINLL